MLLDNFKERTSKLPGNLEVVDTYGNNMSVMVSYKGKLIIGEEKPVGKCKQCGGPIFFDNVTSFDYVCPYENVNKSTQDIIRKL